jgi:hypothetical protein
VFGKLCRLVAVNQLGNGIQVRGVERVLSTNGEANAVNAQRVLFSDPGEVVVHGPTCHQKIFRMDFEKAHIGLVGVDVSKVFGFESQPRPARQPQEGWCKGWVGWAVSDRRIRNGIRLVVHKEAPVFVRRRSSG